MTTERWTTLAERTVVGLVVTIHALVVLAGRQTSDLGHTLQGIFPFCQLTVLLVCLVLIRKRTGLGSAAVAACAVAAPMAWFWMWHDRSSAANEMEVPVLVCTGVLMALPLAGARWCGLRLAPFDPINPLAASHWQFSIRSLVILTTVVAASVACLEGVRPLLEPGGPEKAQWSFAARWVYDSIEDLLRPPLMDIYVLSAAISCISIGTTWAILSPGAIWLRSLLVVSSTATLGVYLAHILHGQLLFGMAIVFLLYAGILAGSLLPLRLWNYRLTRHVATSLAGIKPGPGEPQWTVCSQVPESKFAPGCCATSEAQP